MSASVPILRSLACFFLATLAWCGFGLGIVYRDPPPLYRTVECTTKCTTQVPPRATGWGWAGVGGGKKRCFWHHAARYSRAQPGRHCNGVEGVASSNLAVPTSKIRSNMIV